MTVDGGRCGLLRQYVRFLKPLDSCEPLEGAIVRYGRADVEVWKLQAAGDAPNCRAVSRTPRIINSTSKLRLQLSTLIKAVPTQHISQQAQRRHDLDRAPDLTPL